MIHIVVNSISLISMSSLAIWLGVFFLISPGMAVDVPFVFDETSSGVASYNSDQIEQAHISSPDLVGVPMVTLVEDNDILDFPITGGGNTPIGTTEKRVGDLKVEFDARVEPENPRVNDEAVVLALKYPGDLTIDQIVSIYSYLKNGDDSKEGWGYVRDPRGIDYLRYANASLKLGDRANCVGGGDCDDFAILMAALVESVGGTTRIILARNDTTGGHAYTEVYLGNLDDQNSQVEDIIGWLKEKFGTNKIYTHIDTDTTDIWLNLDWGVDEKGNTHPGGPFYQGDKHIVLCIRDNFGKTPLKLYVKSNKQAKLIHLFSDYHSHFIIGPKSASWNLSRDWYNKGEALYNPGNYNDAIKAYDEAIRLDPYYADAWYKKGNAFYNLGNYNDAIKAYDKSIWIHPDAAEPWNNRGNALYNLGNYNDAIKAYDEAIRLDPYYAAAEVWNNKGFALEALGMTTEANFAFAKAKKLE